MREYLQGLHVWHNGETLPQDAQKGQNSHPPNPGAPRRALSQSRPQLLADPRFTFHASRFTVPVSDARTKLADFFSILSENMSQDIAKRCQSWYNSDPVPM